MSLTGIVYLATFAAGVILAFVRHPIFGLYAYVAAFYLHPPSRWWATDLPDVRWALVAAVVTLIATLRLKPRHDRPSWISTTPARLLVAYAVWLWIQGAWAMEPFEHREFAVLFSKYVVLFYLIYRLIDTPERATSFLMINLAGCAYLGWLAFQAPDAQRLEGVGGPGIDEANALGAQMATAMTIGAVMLLHFKDWRRWFVFLAMPLVLNAMVLTGSRSSFLGVLAGGLVLWYLRPHAYKKSFYAFSVLGIVLFGALAHEAFWQRMQSISAVTESRETMDTSAESRLVLIEAQWRMAKRYPAGTGHRGTATLSPFYLDEKYLTPSYDNPKELARSSHNTFMTTLVEQGIPGALIFTGLLVWFLRTILNLRNFNESQAHLLTMTHAAGVAAAIAVIFTAGMFVDYLKAEIQIWCLALLASFTAMVRGTGDAVEQTESGRGRDAARQKTTRARK